MEKSISILRNTTVNNQAKTKMNINKRRQENNVLISDLESVRASKRLFQKDLEDKTLTIQKMKLEKQKIQREFDKKLSQVEQETLNKVKQVGLMDQGKEEEEKFEEEALYKKTSSKQAAEFFSNEQGVPSKVKGKIFKGTPFTRGNREDKSKIQELQQAIEESNQQILMYKLEKKSLQENLIRILDEKADELGLSEEEKRAQLSKLNLMALQVEQDHSLEQL
jgi:hypothetical protein